MDFNHPFSYSMPHRNIDVERREAMEYLQQRFLGEEGFNFEAYRAAFGDNVQDRLQLMSDRIGIMVDFFMEAYEPAELQAIVNETFQANSADLWQDREGQSVFPNAELTGTAPERRRQLVNALMADVLGPSIQSLDDITERRDRREYNFQHNEMLVDNTFGAVWEPLLERLYNQVNFSRPQGLSLLWELRFEDYQAQQNLADQIENLIAEMNGVRLILRTMVPDLREHNAFARSELLDQGLPLNARGVPTRADDFMGAFVTPQGIRPIALTGGQSGRPTEEGLALYNYGQHVADFWNSDEFQVEEFEAMNRMMSDQQPAFDGFPAAQTPQRPFDYIDGVGDSPEGNPLIHTLEGVDADGNMIHNNDTPPQQSPPPSPTPSQMYLPASPLPSPTPSLENAGNMIDDMFPGEGSPAGQSPLPLQEEAEATRAVIWPNDPAQFVNAVQPWAQFAPPDQNGHAVMDLEALNAVGWGLNDSPVWADELIMQGDGHY